MTHDDPFIADLIAAVRDDPDTIGLLLHGSRAVSHERSDSDYDIIRIVTNGAYDTRRERGTLVEKFTTDEGHKADFFYQTPSRIEKYVSEPGWYTATYLTAQVLFDRTGEIGVLLARIAAEAGRASRDRLAAAYDDYLNSFVRSIKAARRGDELGRRLHSAESATALARTLFGLESAWPPYHDDLGAHLPRIEAAQGWPRGYLHDALLRLVRNGDPAFQQDVEQRVEALMASHGISHEWGNDLEPLKALRFGGGR